MLSMPSLESGPGPTHLLHCLLWLAEVSCGVSERSLSHPALPEGVTVQPTTSKSEGVSHFQTVASTCNLPSVPLPSCLSRYSHPMEQQTNLVWRGACLDWISCLSFCMVFPFLCTCMHPHYKTTHTCG